MMGVLVFSVNALLFAFISLAKLPAEEFMQGTKGIKTIITTLALSAGVFDLIFILIPKLLYRWEKTDFKSVVNPFKAATQYVNDLLFIGLTFIELAAAVAIVAQAASTLANSGSDTELFDAVNAVALFMGEMTVVIVAVFGLENIINKE